MNISSLAVFCGSKSGVNKIYIEHAIKIGQLLAQNNIRLIYGGGSNGIMGAIANSVMTNGGKVSGVIPRLLTDKEHQHDNITELTVVDDMHIRKRKLYDLCDAALILPGGFGTMDELFEILTWNQLFIHNKLIFLLNSGGYYNYLLQHLHQMEAEGFLYEKTEESLRLLNKPEEILPFLK
ncbi:MAG TPA: TIGR00730 family Rossman fold protein [Chitinophagaceae bacterium]|jgi:TIGR00730 family protein